MATPDYSGKDAGLRPLQAEAGAAAPGAAAAPEPDISHYEFTPMSAVRRASRKPSRRGGRLWRNALIFAGSAAVALVAAASITFTLMRGEAKQPRLISAEPPPREVAAQAAVPASDAAVLPAPAVMRTAAVTAPGTDASSREAHEVREPSARATPPPAPASAPPQIATAAAPISAVTPPALATAAIQAAPAPGPGPGPGPDAQSSQGPAAAPAQHAPAPNPSTLISATVQTAPAPPTGSATPPSQAPTATPEHITPAPSPATTAPEAASARAALTEADERAFALASEADTPEAYAAYLANYPGGIHASDAHDARRALLGASGQGPDERSVLPRNVPAPRP
jgi:hypothetical protein